MTNDTMTKGILLLAFVGFLLVEIVDLLIRPDAMIPAVVTTVVGVVIGYAAHAQGVDIGSFVANNSATRATQASAAAHASAVQANADTATRENAGD
jgi:hypothetical protein